jgi:hypothetical protein
MPVQAREIYRSPDRMEEVARDQRPGRDLTPKEVTACTIRI